MIAFTLLNKAIEKPFINKALLKQVEAEVEAKVMKKETYGPSDVGIFVVSKEVVAHTLEANEEEVQHASDAAETVNTCIHLNFISDNNLNSSISPLMTKLPTPTPPQSPKPSLDHTPSLQHDQNLSMCHVTSSPQPTHGLNTSNIAQMLRNFSQQETIPITFVLEELTHYLDGELPFGQMITIFTT